MIVWILYAVGVAVTIVPMTRAIFRAMGGDPESTEERILLGVLGFLATIVWPLSLVGWFVSIVAVPKKDNKDA